MPGASSEILSDHPTDDNFTIRQIGACGVYPNLTFADDTNSLGGISVSDEAMPELALKTANSLGTAPFQRLTINKDIMNVNALLQQKTAKVVGAAPLTLPVAKNNFIIFKPTTGSGTHTYTGFSSSTAVGYVIYYLVNEHASRNCVFPHDATANMLTRSGVDRVLNPGDSIALMYNTFDSTLREVIAPSQLIHINCGGYASLTNTNYEWHSRADGYASFSNYEAYTSDTQMPRPVYWVHPVFIPLRAPFFVKSVHVTWRCSNAMGDELHFYV